ncbi:MULTISPECIES: DUF3920 family protein [Bacillus cereus group]|uniref:DUF3920 domain-containing protein n=1 Tax=Bacillus cereus TaxID=1396 RepID=A0AA44TCD9_BACCE|nr:MULTISPECIES: DUF3920 family protein [Bacillus cereus group]PFA13682.1 hypothetical protein CN373_24370 [Bacillus cereus]PFN09931.1 hypothetical protein COJ55_01630 [Bacillus cereus]PFR23844.1 hypothetical protein COK19_20000 [Bacillus cereus]PFR89413.1 hypothetical protein COK38_24340 [Bacillus cereus]PGZ15898.1 hypothetical protein COE46_14685 [Bacillus cereus]
MELQFQNVYQQAGNWYVLDSEFPWDIQQVQNDVFSLIEKREIPVVFCDTCDTNNVLVNLGEEEEEFLFPLNGFYHKERQMIFVCMWEQYEQVLKTLLHEFRHSMQHENNVLYIEKEVYEARWIERDARAFAERKMNEYMRRNIN